MLYKKDTKCKHELFLTGLVLLSVYLSLGESLIPKPFPWMKLGLANIATIIALEKFNSKMAFEVVVLRIFIQGIMLGTIFTPSFIISLTGGIISTCGMVFLYQFRKYLSLISISSLAAFIHNGLQLIVVYFLIFRGIEINSKSVLMFVWIFLLVGVISGGITGIIVEKIKLRRVVYSE
ncbi:MAG: Gx transporter family protein [Fusobacteriaceae bacterium]